MTFWSLILWFIMLIKWADILVEWASSVAKKFGISNLIIGLTIVAFGTSAPELVVNLLAWFNWETDLAISNVLWSNISNILLILWVTALIYPIAFAKSLTKKEIPFMVLISFVLTVLVIFWNGLVFIDAIVLSLFFILFLYYTFKSAKNSDSSDDEDIKEEPLWKSTLFIILGLTGLIVWANFIVDSAVSIAEWFWMPKSLVGVTIVAIWTSLPELAAWVAAALKKKTDIAIGWVVGSNIFNTLWILGATGLLTDLPAYKWFEVDLMVNLWASLLLLSMPFVYKKMQMGKWKGILFVSLYFSYIWYLIYGVLSK